MTINYSQSVAECAIPVKGSTTGKDAQSYGKEQEDCSLSDGMMEDECVRSPGVCYSLTVENRKHNTDSSDNSFSIKHSSGCTVYFNHTHY